MCDLASHHVDFVAIGHSDKHVGIFGACLVKPIGVRCAADHRADIEAVRKSAQLISVSVLDYDVILFVG